MPTLAAELCITPVTPAPMSMPTRGLSAFIIQLRKTSESLSGSMAFCISSIPINSMPKPASACPTYFSEFFLAKRIINAPINIAIGAIPVRFSETRTLVVVVPIFAPIITPIACVKFIRPVLTKPTTITVVAEELCISVVMRKPTSTARKRFFVIFSSKCLRRDPAASSSPSPISLIPYKSKPRPPAKVR